MTDAAIHRVSRDAVDLSVRLPDHSGSPRAFSPRDDKVRQSAGRFNPCLSLRGGSEARHLAFTRVTLQPSLFHSLDHSGSPRAYALAMTKGEGRTFVSKHNLSLRGGNVSDGRGNPSYLAYHGRLVCSLTGSQWIATGLTPSR